VTSLCFVLFFLPACRTSAHLADPVIALRFPHLCLLVCVSALITCAMITSHHYTLLPCDFTLMATLSTATVSSLAQLRVQDTKEKRQHRCKAEESGYTRSEQLLVMPTEQLTDWELLPEEYFKWIRMFKGPAGFLDVKYQTCWFSGVWTDSIVYTFLPPGDSSLYTVQICMVVISWFYSYMRLDCWPHSIFYPAPRLAIQGLAHSSVITRYDATIILIVS